MNWLPAEVPLEEVLFPSHKAGLMLQHNEHKTYYQSAENYIEENLTDENVDWESEVHKQRAIATDEIWHLHWYPNTPVGSQSIAAPTLKELLEFAKKIEEGRG